MELKAELKNATEAERLEFIIEYNHTLGYQIEEEIIDTKEIVDEDDGTVEVIHTYNLKAWGDTEDEKAAKREESFLRQFFETSLGWIRRSVTMKDGSTKDFLTDLLPVISMGVQSGQQVTILAYDKPGFDKDVEDWEQYQHKVIATPEFIQECSLQVSRDFGG